MYVPAPQSFDDWARSSGADSGSYGIGDLAPGARLAPEGGFPVLDALKLGRLGFQALAPETYSSLTSWLPSWQSLGLPTLGEIGTSLGLEGIFGAAPVMEGGGVAAGSGLTGAAGAGASMGALGGAMTAAGYAAPMLAFAKIMAAINQNTDHPITLGSGYTSLEDGFYGGQGPRVGEAKGLADLYRGDGGWYAGGDPSMVEDLDTAFGSMSWKKNIPAYSVGGAAYRTPDLAANSGRQIARGQMGLPVTLEDLPDMFRGSPDFSLLSQYQGNASLPVWDAPRQMPSDWDQWQERAQNSSYSGQSNTEANAWAPEIIQSYAQSLGPRGEEWFRTGLTYGDLYSYTGQNSPDWELNEYDLTGAQDDTLSRVAAANGIEGTPPLNVFEYAMGPGRVFNPGRTNLRSGE